MIMLPRVLRLLPIIGTLCLPAGLAFAETPRIYTNQQYVEDSMAKLDFDIKDVKSVFRMVLASLPGEVTVYPTENYYYFWFNHGGIKYAGNFRFDIEDRDQGLVHFNYFKDFTHWQRDEGDYSALLGAKDQVTVTKVNALAYDVSFEGRTVRFNLNDLSKVKPPEGAVAKGETYIGPIFDESGMRFFLVFNNELKTFLYIMDETVPQADQFNLSTVSDRISIGIRTGFAYYDDRFAHRKILVGVNVLNTSVNNYLDGPFDQLPDNFIPGKELERSILAASPEMAGHMDRLGNSPDGETRYLIAPYLQYEDESELKIVAECANHEDLPTFYNCFNFEGVDEGDDGSGDVGDSGDSGDPGDADAPAGDQQQ
jgi:hypothetical protein